jgi:hypothetical protein
MTDPRGDFDDDEQNIPIPEDEDAPLLDPVDAEDEADEGADDDLDLDEEVERGEEADAGEIAPDRPVFDRGDEI